MPDNNDFYADQFQVHIGPFGCSLNFQLTSTTPPPAGAPPQVDRVATVRMSLELLKALVFILHRQMVSYENQARLNVGLPSDILRAMQIREEDWQAFWHP